jgi:integrase
VNVRQLSPAERRRLLADTGNGLEPAMFWLGEDGWPLAVPTWKSMFAAANKRCADQGAAVSCHAHMLRHSFAVVTLEQLQRGHIAALAELSADQRGHYTRIFGDPLDWVRRRLGHRSVLTTVSYLHALQELEMETRMALVPDVWEDPRDTPLHLIGDDAAPSPSCRPPAAGAGA